MTKQSSEARRRHRKQDKEKCKFNCKVMLSTDLFTIINKKLNEASECGQ
jgi:hypothetical protein